MTHQGALGGAEWNYSIIMLINVDKNFKTAKFSGAFTFHKVKKNLGDNIKNVMDIKNMTKLSKCEATYYF